MKHKAFLVLIVLGFTFGSMALANYIEPQSTTNPSCTWSNTSKAPECNTPTVVKTGPGANVSGSRAVTVIKSKIGIGDGTTFTGNSFVSTGSYIGTGTGNKGGFAEKLYAGGTTSVIGGSTPKDLLIQIYDESSNKGTFDQYAAGTQYIYPVGASKRMTKALEAIVAGRYISKIAITNNQDVDDIQKRKLNPTNSLEFQPTSGSNAFLPTTNIGLGNSCNLYPYDLGSTAGDGGGCPKGSYMTWYTPPTVSGAVTSTNNTNSTIVAKCKEFNPATSPTTTGHCSTGKTAFSDVNYVQKTTSGSQCMYYLFTTTGTKAASFNGSGLKIKWYEYSNDAQDSGTPTYSYRSSYDDKTSFNSTCGTNYSCGGSCTAGTPGCGPCYAYKAVITDSYGQYTEIEGPHFRSY